MSLFNQVAQTKTKPVTGKYVSFSFPRTRPVPQPLPHQKLMEKLSIIDGDKVKKKLEDDTLARNPPTYLSSGNRERPVTSQEEAGFSARRLGKWDSIMFSSGPGGWSPGRRRRRRLFVFVWDCFDTFVAVVSVSVRFVEIKLV